jgi:hypothetical protein
LAITLGEHEWHNLASSNKDSIRRFYIAAGVIQYGYEANAKNIRAARRDSEKMRPLTLDTFAAVVAKATITPSSKLMTLFNWRRIGRAVRENSSAPTWI